MNLWEKLTGFRGSVFRRVQNAEWSRSRRSSITLTPPRPPQGCDFRRSAVSTVVFPDGVRSCMETQICIVFL